MNRQWAVYAPGGQPGQKLRVVRKDGAVRHVTLGAPLEGYPDCYEAAQVRTGRTGTPRRAVQAPPPETKTMKGTGRPGQVLGPPWWTVISNNNGVMVLRPATQAEVEAVEDEIAAYKRLTQCQR